MRLTAACAITLLCSVASQPALAQPSCDSESERLYERALQADAQARLEDARALFTQAAERCDRAEYWLAVGNIWVEDFLGDSADAVNAEGEPAIAAYGNAFEAARRDQDSANGGTAARAMVELGLRAGDPLKANEWLLVAQQLEPDHEDLAMLQEEVDFAREELSASEIEAGLNQTRGLGRVSSLLAGGTVASTYGFSESPEGVPEPGGGGSAPAAPDREETVGAIDIPINFETNSTVVTASTARNIENLAAVLAQRPEGETITLVGHADARGSADYNLVLSELRAAAIRDQLERLQPGLNGRIATAGRGESEPADPGDTERAHANNRRLEVIISS